MTKPTTIASRAKAIAKAAQAEAPALAAAADRALAEKTAAHEAFCRAEAAWGDARAAKARNDQRAEAAAALARLADRPDLIDLLIDGKTPPEEIGALVRRGLMAGSKNGARVTSYHWTNLAYRVADLAREIRATLSPTE